MFVYFVPTARQSPTQSEYDQIPHACCPGMQHATTTSGPSDSKGLFLARSAAPASALNNNGEWKKVPGSTAWFKQVSPADPAKLSRDPQLPGHFVELQDGNRWMIPRAMLWIDRQTFGIALPCHDKLDDDGQWQRGQIVPRYARLWEYIERMHSGEMSYHDEVELCTLAIGYNYFLGPAECSALGIWSDSTRRATVAAILDTPGLEDIKKNAGRDT